MRSLGLFSSLFVSSVAFAAWSAFSIISPDNIEKYSISLTQASKTKETIEFCLTDEKVRPSNTIIYKSAWLLEIDSNISEQDLNFEQHFNKTNTNLNIQSTKNLTAYSEDKDSCQMKFKVSRGNMDKLFIFVGYEVSVNDGGLRYTIPLEAFQ